MLVYFSNSRLRIACIVITRDADEKYRFLGLSKLPQNQNLWTSGLCMLPSSLVAVNLHCTELYCPLLLQASDCLQNAGKMQGGRGACFGYFSLITEQPQGFEDDPGDLRMLQRGQNRDFLLFGATWTLSLHYKQVSKDNLAHTKKGGVGEG